MTGHRSNDRFDLAMRELHRDALAHLGADTRRRLRDARSAATPPARERRFGWPLASACAALFALAIAWPLRSPPPAAADRAPAPTASRPGPAAPAATAPVPTEIPVAIAALEESPDFYLWLASNDATPDLLEPRR